jgi:hypothetical protein
MPQSWDPPDTKDTRSWFSRIGPGDLLLVRLEDGRFAEIDLETQEGVILTPGQAQAWFPAHGRAADLPHDLTEVAIEPGPSDPREGGRARPPAAESGAPGLHPNWRPTADLSTRRKDGNEVLDSHGTEDPSNRTGTVGSDAVGKDENANPLTETLDLIPRSTHLPTVIRFLAERTGRRAKLRDISKRVYKAVDKGSLAKTRKLITRNVPLLERRNTPLRLLWDNETKVASLHNSDGT